MSAGVPINDGEARSRPRAEFHVKFKEFLATLHLVLPRPEALPFLGDVKTLVHIQIRARNRYRGGERPWAGKLGRKSAGSSTTV